MISVINISSLPQAQKKCNCAAHLLILVQSDEDGNFVVLALMRFTSLIILQIGLTSCIARIYGESNHLLLVVNLV